MRNSNARISVLSALGCPDGPSKSRGSEPPGKVPRLHPFPGKNVLQRLSMIEDRWCRQYEMRTVDAVVTDLVVTNPIGIRRATNMVGHSTSSLVHSIGAEVRHVPFERRAQFRIGA